MSHYKLEMSLQMYMPLTTLTVEASTQPEAVNKDSAEIEVLVAEILASLGKYASFCDVHFDNITFLYD